MTGPARTRTSVCSNMRALLPVLAPLLGASRMGTPRAMSNSKSNSNSKSKSKRKSKRKSKSNSCALRRVRLGAPSGAWCAKAHPTKCGSATRRQTKRGKQQDKSKRASRSSLFSPRLSRRVAEESGGEKARMSEAMDGRARPLRGYALGRLRVYAGLRPDDSLGRAGRRIPSNAGARKKQAKHCFAPTSARTRMCGQAGAPGMAACRFLQQSLTGNPGCPFSCLLLFGQARAEQERGRTPKAARRAEGRMPDVKRSDSRPRRGAKAVDVDLDVAVAVAVAVAVDLDLPAPAEIANLHPHQSTKSQKKSPGTWPGLSVQPDAGESIRT